MAISETHRKLKEVGEKVLSATRNELLVEMRYLGPALDALTWEMDLSTRTFGTDAVAIRYNPACLTRLYLEQPLAMNRAYLHMLLHCLFRHMFKDPPEQEEINRARRLQLDRAVASGAMSPMERSEMELDDLRDLWNLSCDIAVESILDGMESPAIARVTSDFREEWYAALKQEAGVLTAEKIYACFTRPEMVLTPYDYEHLLREFTVDDHSFWARLHKPGENPAPDDAASGGNPDKKQDNSDSADHSEPPQNPVDPDAGDSGGDGGNPGGEDHFPEGEDEEDRPSREMPPMSLAEVDKRDEQWKENARRIASDIEQRDSEAGDERGSLSRMLAIDAAKKRCYRDYLKHFLILREECRVDPDSFDYAYYTYGIEHYGNMPLIEENEFRESQKIDELVIAIDTSASCQKTQVQKFLNETAGILLDTEHFTQRVNIHVIECDDQVQRDVLITSREEMTSCADSFELRGGYGTDFRPVFTYVERLRREGTLRHLRGLMYFTDGYGEYPARATDYETAFVFIDGEDIDTEHVPDWTLTLYM